MLRFCSPTLSACITVVWVVYEEGLERASCLALLLLIMSFFLEICGCVMNTGMLRRWFFSANELLYLPNDVPGMVLIPGTRYMLLNVPLRVYVYFFLELKNAGLRYVAGFIK